MNDAIALRVKIKRAMMAEPSQINLIIMNEQLEKTAGYYVNCALFWMEGLAGRECTTINEALALLNMAIGNLEDARKSLENG